MKRQKARLILEDGTVFNGFAFGSTKNIVGEVVFNTGMVGYPESLTDPSYHGQILTYTYPLIGNYGVPARKLESDQVQVSGVVCSELQDEYSHWEAKMSLENWLKQFNIPGITGIDTRALTKKLRSHGVMLGQIILDSRAALPRNKWQDPNSTNLVSQVSIAKPRWHGHGQKSVLLVDCGVKLSIIRDFISRGIKIKQVPWDYNFISELDNFNGVFISNGPGDPKKCVQTIANVKAAFKSKKPQFGICLGSQIQGLAAGAKTYKLKYGHRGQNQPCVYENTARGVLTSQNHGYAVRESSIPKSWRVLFRNANDNSIEGIQHKTLPFFSVQFHPEAHPGPTDAHGLFDNFIKMLK